jgi:hypothetical protein
MLIDKCSPTWLWREAVIFNREGKVIPLQAWTCPEVSRRLRLPDFSRYVKVVRFSALSTGRLYPLENIPGTLLLEAESPQGHYVAGRIMSMKNSNNTIGNRTRNLLNFSAVPQPTEPLRIFNRKLLAY